MGCGLFSAPRTTVQQASTMTKQQEALLSSLIGTVEGGVGQPYQGFPGSRVAGFGPLQQQAFGLAGQIPGATMQGMQGAFSPLGDSGAFAPLAQRAQGLFGDLSESVLDRFSQTGTAGSGGAQRELAKQARLMTEGVAAQALPYELGFKQMGLQAAGLPGQTAGQMFNLGLPQQDQQQALIGEQIQRFQEQQPIYSPMFGAAAQLAGVPAFENIGVQQGAGLGRSLLGSAIGAAGAAASGGSTLLSGFGFSDERLKKNIKTEFIKNGIRFVTWEWNKKAEKYGLKGKSFGVIAQELMKIIPNAVREFKDGYLGVDYSLIIV